MMNPSITEDTALDLVDEAAVLYRESIGSPMPDHVRATIMNGLLHGLPMEYVRYALTQTQLAPRPSWYYARAIIQRLVRERACYDALGWERPLIDGVYVAPSIRG